MNKKKIIKMILIVFLFSIFFFLFLFYGPIESFKEFWITSAMNTKSHQYLATFFYSDQYIQEVLRRNYVSEVDEISNPDDIHFKKYSLSIYRNKYEKEILERDADALYKVVEVNGHGYQGFLVAIYDPSRIYLATTDYLFQKGESILTVSRREKAIIAMNAGGFFDPDWNSNGAIPHGVVISNGKVVSEFQSANRENE